MPRGVKLAERGAFALLCRVKFIDAFGNVNIAAQQTFGQRRAKHDAWPTHGIWFNNDYYTGFDISQPLQSCAAQTFTLKSGDTFVYFYGGWQSCFGGLALNTQANAYKPLGNGVTYWGLSFNHIYRPALTAKISAADFYAYLNGFGLDATDCP